ncbi:MAG: tRNA 2-thiouridine(34) synthase MnmA [Verrucomicrobiales bacterium]|jgi:tRNA-specific 2-thiouridylase|nr:tRNA 2-thiouridine(34) synthase MnmA [Verrucomicrobiales bacterium]
MAKILVALSGGVDSSVAAALLQEQGHTVSGAYMKNWINEENVAGNCPWQQDIEDAAAVADRLGMPFRVVNLMREYRERVVNYLLAGYAAGVTPNPDVMCNREMKFGALLDYALREGFDHVATGHYARKVADGESFDLLEGADPNKDQSYFLALLRQRQVARALFPVGDLPKPEVRRLAARFGLATAAKKDSQGICFIGAVKMADFLAKFIPDRPGDIVDWRGRRLGEHRGLHLYTLGQRKGIRVPSNTPNQAYVVLEKRVADNALVVGFDRPDTPQLYAAECVVSQLSCTNRPLTVTADREAKPRYRARRQRVTFTPSASAAGVARLKFHQPQRALAPGQICALYDGPRLLGGGIFTEIIYR